MIGIRRPAFQDIWSAVRIGFTRLNSALADAGDSNDMVFQTRKPESSGASADMGRRPTRPEPTPKRSDPAAAEGEDSERSSLGHRRGTTNGGFIV
jgi:hypothetical protein